MRKRIQHYKLGIIGGAGPYASALLYQFLCRAHYDSKQMKGSSSMPEVFIVNYPFTRGLTLKEFQAHAEILRSELQYCIDTLADQQVTEMIIACNTLHAFVPLLDLKQIKFTSIPQLVMQEAIQRGKKKILLLATQTTKSSEIYQNPDLEIVYPKQQEQELLDTIIDRILLGRIQQKDSHCLEKLIQTIQVREKIEGVILGCTDLPVLHHFHPLQVNIPLFDSIQIPAQTLIKHFEKAL